MNRSLALFGLLLCGCPKTAPSESPADAWREVRAGRVFAAGDLFVHVRPEARDLERGLPGVGFGDERGPRFGLLGGYYAPQILMSDSARSYAATTTVEGDVLVVRLVADEEVAELRVPLPRAGRVSATIQGSALLAPPSDRTTIRGMYEDQPAFSFEISPGDDAGLVTPRADVVEIEPRGHEAWRVQTGCARVRVLRPRLTGSTSVFLVAVGPAPRLEDDVYATPGSEERPEDLDRCARTATSTLSFARAATRR